MSELFPSGEMLDKQRADHLNKIELDPIGIYPDIIATPVPSARHRVTRMAARVVGSIGLVSAAFGGIDTYEGATQDIPKARDKIVQAIEEIDMDETDKAITTKLFTEEGLARIAETSEEVKETVQANSSNLEEALSRTANGTVQTGLGAGMFAAGVGTNFALKRRARKLGSPLKLNDNNSIDHVIFPALYEDRVTRRHISRYGQKDTSHALELRPSTKYQKPEDKIEFNAFRLASATLLGAYIAATPLASATAETIDGGVTMLQQSRPVATASTWFAEKATNLAEPTIEREVKETTDDLIQDKLPRTNQLAKELPLMQALKERVQNETAEQVINTQKPSKLIPSETNALGELQANFAIPRDGTILTLYGAMGLGGTILTRTIQRKSTRQANPHASVRVSKDFLDANLQKPKDNNQETSE